MAGFLPGLFFISLSCKEPFEPDINESVELISIDASLIKGRTIQYIAISRSTSINSFEYKAVSRCDVKIVDELGNEFQFEEETNGSGLYTAEIDDNLLVNGRQYKLNFNTQEGEEYESEYQSIIESADVDSVYGIQEDVYDTDEEKTVEAMQFYIDLKAPDTGSRYYRWELSYTYEYHSVYKINGIYDGDTTYLYSPPFDSIYTCWNTEKITQLFSSSTENLVQNEKKRIPLHYVPTKSRKLSVRYSLLIKQYALNENAYNYWNQKKNDMQESGGLYTNQPSQTKSNIYNINNREETVLGYFWASSEKQKRIFLDQVFYFRYPYGVCELEDFNLRDHGRGPFPVYILGGIYSRAQTADQSCFDCTMLGGVLDKPDFW